MAYAQVPPRDLGVALLSEKLTNMLKNKHITVALLIAPILSLIAYFATDRLVSEQPHSAQKGRSYKLVASSNCRYTSGLCDMKNGDFKLQFRVLPAQDQHLQFILTSIFPLEGVKLALVDQPEQNTAPIDMQPNDHQLRSWSITLPKPSTKQSTLRVAVQANGSLYFGETNTQFVEYKTLFSQQPSDD